MRFIVTMRNEDGTNYLTGLSWSNMRSDAELFRSVEDASAALRARFGTKYMKGDGYSHGPARIHAF